jgi:hypothetical protein
MRRTDDLLQFLELPLLRRDLPLLTGDLRLLFPEMR